MRHTPRHYIVCYDIADKGRLRAVYKVMRSFGDAMQYSVFRCRLSAIQRARMDAALLRVIRPSEDQVVIVDLGPQKPESRMTTLGQPMVHVERVVRVIE